MTENPYQTPEAEVSPIQQQPSLVRKLLPYGILTLAIYLAAVVGMTLSEAFQPDADRSREGLIIGAAFWGVVAVWLFYLFWRLRR